MDLVGETIQAVEYTDDSEIVIIHTEHYMFVAKPMLQPEIPGQLPLF